MLYKPYEIGDLINEQQFQLTEHNQNKMKSEPCQRSGKAKIF